MPCAVARNNELISAFNSVVLQLRPANFASASGSGEWKSGQQTCAGGKQTKSLVSPQDFIWLELSLIPEVERVFVETRGNHFDVVTVVNDRDEALRKRIFAREKAIIDSWPHYDFDFGILTRMNHDINDLVSVADRPAYIRR